MSGARDPSGPAFPSHGSIGEVVHEGMSLRDYFAASAPFSLTDAVLAADLESQAPSVGAALARVLHNSEKRATALAMLARLRTEYADAMLKARAT